MVEVLEKAREVEVVFRAVGVGVVEGNEDLVREDEKDLGWLWTAKGRALFKMFAKSGAVMVWRSRGGTKYASKRAVNRAAIAANCNRGIGRDKQRSLSTAYRLVERFGFRSPDAPGTNESGWLARLLRNGEGQLTAIVNFTNVSVVESCCCLDVN